MRGVNLELRLGSESRVAIQFAIRSTQLAAILLFALGVQAALAVDIAPGVTYTEYTLAGPNKVYVVAVDLAHSEYKLKVGWNGLHRNFGSCASGCTSCTGKLAVTGIASQYDNPGANSDVLAATNGSYFGCPPDIVGWPVASDGEIVQAPYFSGDPTLAQVETMRFGPDRMPVVETGVGTVTGVLTFANGITQTIDQYNTPQAISTLTAFTPGYDTSTRSTAQGVEVILSNVTYPMRSDKEVSGIVTAVKTGTASLNNAIPAGGMVLNAFGSPASSLLTNSHVGDRLKMLFKTTSQGMNNADMAITGSGWILHNGIANPPTPGCPGGNWSTSCTLPGTGPFGVNPLTVMAWSNTKFFMVVCDGRGCGGTVGMTFQNMADFLTSTPEIAALEALNFDGGGSSTMVVDGVLKNKPSDTCGAGGTQRAVANAIMLVKQTTATSFPVIDPFASTGRLAGWDDKFAYNPVSVFSPVSPKGDGYALKVIDPSGVNTARRGDWGDADYAIQADIYCEYRPAVAADGYERYGLFARDSGTGALGLSTYGGGNCYALCCDSDTGSLRAGKYVNGTFTDLASLTIQGTRSGWARFRIECSGSTITYRINGGRVLTITDTSFTHGCFGVGYQSLFATASNRHGTRADNFRATTGTPVQPGDMDFDGDVDNSDFGLFQMCFSGVDIAQNDLFCQGARLDADGDIDDSDFVLFGGCMSGANITANPLCSP